MERARVYPLGNEFIVDVATALKYATGVTMENGGLEIAYKGNGIVLTDGSKQAIVNGNPVKFHKIILVKKGVAYVLIREVAGHIGLSTSVYNSGKRFEIANFPMKNKSGLWLE